MKRLPVFLAALALAATAHASDETSSSDNKPGVFHRLLHPFAKSPPAKPTPASASTVGKGNWRRLNLTMMLEPVPLKLPETRQLKATLVLVNHSSKLVQMEFPTTQRIEVVVKNSAGKLVEQWSEDRAFTPEPGIISINPGERLVYSAMVATRDMTAGETYTVEGYFPNYEGLRVQKSILPER